jgi:hypothetical protein
MRAIQAALALLAVLAFTACEPRPPKPRTDYFFVANSHGGTAFSSAHSPIFRSRA